MEILPTRSACKYFWIYSKVIKPVRDAPVVRFKKRQALIPRRTCHLVVVAAAANVTVVVTMAVVVRMSSNVIALVGEVCFGRLSLDRRARI